MTEHDPGALTSERLSEIRLHVERNGVCAREMAPELLAHIDALTADNARLRGEVERLTKARDIWKLSADYANDEAADTSADLTARLQAAEQRAALCDRLAAAFKRHRTATHTVQPKVCETCLESDAVLAEYDAQRATGQGSGAMIGRLTAAVMALGFLGSTLYLTYVYTTMSCAPGTEVIACGGGVAIQSWLAGIATFWALMLIREE